MDNQPNPISRETVQAVAAETEDDSRVDLDTAERAEAVASLASAEHGVDIPVGETLLEVRGLKKWFPIKSGFIRHTTGWVKAVDDISFNVNRGETFAIVGESGCGKSTAGRAILQLETPTGGDVIFHPSTGEAVNLVHCSKSELQQVRPQMKIIFQDPFSSLDGRMTVGRSIGEPLAISGELKGHALKDRVAELLVAVGLRPEHANRYPHAFSGGQRQRIGIARALALNPDLIVCDEAVSALDVSVQAQVLNLLERLQRELDLTYIFISHDLSVVEHISDHVAVMYVGKVVEISTVEDLFRRPRHPYSAALLDSVPKPDPTDKTAPEMLVGEVPSPANPPGGCYFHTRCPFAQPICATEEPPLRDVDGRGHLAACHFADDLQLDGVKPVPPMEFQVPTRPAAGVGSLT